jgi:hypothetical protein
MHEAAAKALAPAITKLAPTMVKANPPLPRHYALTAIADGKVGNGADLISLPEAKFYAALGAAIEDLQVPKRAAIAGQVSTSTTIALSCVAEWERGGFMRFSPDDAARAVNTALTTAFSGLTASAKGAPRIPAVKPTISAFDPADEIDSEHKLGALLIGRDIAESFDAEDFNALLRQVHATGVLIVDQSPGSIATFSTEDAFKRAGLKPVIGVDSQLVLAHHTVAWKLRQHLIGWLNSAIDPTFIQSTATVFGDETTLFRSRSALESVVG